MAKSLMNRTLNQLESQELITRTRSLADKRQVLVTFNMEKAEVYLKQHQEILLRQTVSVLFWTDKQCHRSRYARLQDVCQEVSALHQKL